MHKEIDYYENKLQDLYNRLGKANELVQDLKESKEDVIIALEKIEEENKHLMDENEHLHKQITETQQIYIANPSPQKNQSHLPHKSLTLSLPMDEIQEKETSNFSESEDENSPDPNIEKFLKQINELKAVCQKQGEALIRFQETMESTKEDNDRLQNVLSELENEKKGMSDMFGNSEFKSCIFENLPSPVAMRSPESSLFISAFDAVEFDRKIEQKTGKKYMEELKLFNRHSFGFVQNGLLFSHISGLKI